MTLAYDFFLLTGVFLVVSSAVLLRQLYQHLAWSGAQSVIALGLTGRLPPRPLLWLPDVCLQLYRGA